MPKQQKRELCVLTPRDQLKEQMNKLSASFTEEENITLYKRLEGTLDGKEDSESKSAILNAPQT